MQRVDLWPALTLLLMANTKRESEHWAKAVFDRGVALDLAANVTDDAAKPRASCAISIAGMPLRQDTFAGMYQFWVQKN